MREIQHYYKEGRKESQFLGRGVGKGGCARWPVEEQFKMIFSLVPLVVCASLLPVLEIDPQSQMSHSYWLGSYDVLVASW